MRIQELLESYFIDPHLDEVLINGSDQVLLLRADKSQRQTAASPFPIASEMIRVCQQLAWSQNLRLDPLMPAAGGAIEASINDQVEQFRWHCLLPPVSRDGPLLSLRRHRLDKLTIDSFATTEMQSILARVSLAPGPLFIAGPTGAGKTSLMMALLRAQATEQRVAILEQTAELPRIEPGWIRLQAQHPDLEGRGAFSLSQGFDELLRLRPDRIIIGELRQKEEVQAIRRAVLAGHGSVWATLHASKPGTLAARLADLAQEDERTWEQLLREQEAHLILMNRDAPRVKSVWQWGNEGWREIITKKMP